MQYVHITSYSNKHVHLAHLLCQVTQARGVIEQDRHKVENLMQCHPTNYYTSYGFSAIFRSILIQVI